MSDPFKINFKNWFNLSEVTFSDGRFSGKKHFQVPTSYLIWYIKKFQDGQLLYKFNIDEIKDMLDEVMRRKTSHFTRELATLAANDKTFFRDITTQQANDILAALADAKGVPPITLREPAPAPASEPAVTPTPVSRPAPTPAAVSDRRDWFLAKIIAPYASLDIGTFVAVTKSMVDSNNFEYIKVDDPSISGILSLDQAKKHLESQRDPGGQIVKINKPEAGKIDAFAARFISISKPKREEVKKELSDAEKSSKYVLTNLDKPENIEQKSIDQKFVAMMKSSKQSHLMINALAGSGKTTMLNHLAWKYGKPGQRWLYLVFNAKNRHEAKTKFPSWVQVETTNSFLQKELNEYRNKKVFGGTTLITTLLGEKDKFKKLDLLADTVDCANFMRTLNLPDPRLAIPRSTFKGGKKYATKNYVQRYLTSIKLDAVKMVEIAKSFSLDPNDPDCENKLREIMYRNYWPHEKRTTAMKLWLDKGKFGENVIIPSIIESRVTPVEGDFEKHDKEATYKIAMWLFQHSLPKATKETVQIDGREYNLGDLRDFVDDLWFSSLYADKLTWSKFDVVMADEVQDFSENQKIMLRKLAEQGAKVIAVGDPNQSIYKFRGADHNSFNSIKDLLISLSANKDVEQTLTRNFRSKKGVIDYVNMNTIVNNLRQGKEFEAGDEGEVTVNKHTDKKSVDLIDLDLEMNKKDPNHKVLQTAYISRNAAPLSSIAVLLLRKSIPFIMFGKDTINEIYRAISKYCGGPEGLARTASADLPAKIKEYSEGRAEKFGGKAAATKSLQDERELATTIGMTLQEFEKEPAYDKTAKGYLEWMKNKVCPSIDVEKLSEEDAKKLDQELEDKKIVILTTAHRSKGFEFDRVFIVNHGMLGAKVRKRDFEISNEAHDSDNIQEENIKYVAFTRAKDQLHLLKVDDDEGAKKDRIGGDDDEGATTDID
jgi:hypothetical protein